MKAKAKSKIIGKGKITFSRAVGKKTRTVKTRTLRRFTQDYDPSRKRTKTKRPGCTPDRERYKRCMKTVKGIKQESLDSHKKAGTLTPLKRAQISKTYQYHYERCQVEQLCVDIAY